MLKRILEAEVMDTAADAADYDAMDFATVNARFAEECLATFHPAISKVIDIGTGTARIPIEMAKRNATLHITAVDLSEQMLKLAERNIQTANLQKQIAIQLVDAKMTGLGDGSFDAVVSNSIVHHIPEPIAFFREAIRLCRPNGTLFIRDLFRPDNQNELDHLVATYAGNDTAHQRQLFYDSLHAALTVHEVRNMVQELGFSADSVQATSDRHWTWIGVKAVV